MTQQTVTSPPEIPDYMLEPKYIAAVGAAACKWWAKEFPGENLLGEGDGAVVDTLAHTVGRSSNVKERPFAKEWTRYVIANNLYDDYVLATAARAAEPEIAPVIQLPVVTEPAPASVFVEKDMHWTDDKESNPDRDWGTYYVKLPGTLAAALKQMDRDDGRVCSRHIRLYSAMNLHTQDGEGGEGLATLEQLARESGWAKRSISKEIVKGAPLYEWVQRTGMTSQGRITFNMHHVEDKKQWYRVPWWWLWEEATWATPERATIRPTITDNALLAGLAIQMAADNKDFNWVLDDAGKKMAASASISTYGTQGVATRIGVDERLVKEGLREGHGLGWFLNSNDDVDPKHVGGRSIKPERTVLFHRPSTLSVPPSTLSVPPL